MVYDIRDFWDFGFFPMFGNSKQNYKTEEGKVLPVSN
jgi:hypothetical protein